MAEKHASHLYILNVPQSAMDQGTRGFDDLKENDDVSTKKQQIIGREKRFPKDSSLVASADFCPKTEDACKKYSLFILYPL